MNKLYLECCSGISGDMTVAALLDAGADEAVLRAGLESLGVEGYRVEISRVSKNGIDCCDFHVILDKQAEGDCRHGHHAHHGKSACCHHHPYNDDQAGEHGHYYEESSRCQRHNEHSHWEESHTHEQRHGHTQGNDHGQEAEEYGNINHNPGFDAHFESLSRTDVSGFAHHGSFHNEAEHIHGRHEHRSLPEINRMIDASGISIRAKQLAKAIFLVVAQAEAKIHGKAVEEVHFHEVGAVDSIVDIVGAAICIDDLDVSDVTVSPLHEGTGFVHCQHGRLPVPAPAVLEIVRSAGIPLIITQAKGEMVTPTGAAIAAALAQHYGTPRQMRIKAVGYGAGKKEMEHPNLLRAVVYTDNEGDGGEDAITVLESDIDDCSGEQMAYCMEKLFEAGARDVSFSPAFMKKNRPGYLLTVVCSLGDEKRLAKIIFVHTTSIGVRLAPKERIVMERHMDAVETPFGRIAVKRCSFEEIRKSYVEYESAKKAAETHNVPIDEVMRAAR